MCQVEVAIRKYTIYGGRQFRKEIGMRGHSREHLKEVIDTLDRYYLRWCNSKNDRNIAYIKASELRNIIGTLVKIEQGEQVPNDENKFKKVVTISEANEKYYEIALNDGYKISASSCNSRTWKAILVKEDKEQESE